jgi:hypothetical protein
MLSSSFLFELIDCNDTPQLVLFLLDLLTKLILDDFLDILLLFFLNISLFPLIYNGVLDLTGNLSIFYFASIMFFWNAYVSGCELPKCSNVIMYAL